LRGTPIALRSLLKVSKAAGRSALVIQTSPAQAMGALDSAGCRHRAHGVLLDLMPPLAAFNASSPSRLRSRLCSICSTAQHGAQVRISCCGRATAGSRSEGGISLIYLASGFVGYVIPASVAAMCFRAARLSLAGRSLSRVSARSFSEGCSACWPSDAVLRRIGVCRPSAAGASYCRFWARRPHWSSVRC